MIRIAGILLALISSLNCAFAQKIRNASGKAQFRLEAHMSQEDLKEKLRHQAIINAIENEYGSFVTQESFIEVDDGSTQFRIFGNSVIRGEWLKTTNEVFSEEIRQVKENGRKKHELWMSLKISGKVRELTQPEINFSYFTSNCLSEACKTGIFEHSQPLYLHFSTPEDGYLTIYVVEKDNAYRLLPYQNMPVRYKDAVPVEADRAYVFFSNQYDYFEDFSSHLIDELVMLTEQEEEYLDLYLIFSTEKFIKPGLGAADVEESTGYGVPKSLHAAMLKNWLEDNRMNNMNFYYRQVKLRIVN